jgi:hypothetical protein
MAKKSDNTGLNYYTLKNSAKEFLLERRVVTIQDLEDHLFDKYHKKWEEGAFDDLDGRKRKRWENLVDWVKANLTKEDFTAKVEVLGISYIYHTPVRAQILKEGAGSLVMEREHMATMQALARRIDAA